MLVVLVVLSFVGGVIWWWLLRRLAPEADQVVRTADYGLGEAVFAGVLTMFFLLNIVAANGERLTITLEVIIQGGILYGLIAAMIWGTLLLRGRDPRLLFGLSTRRLAGNLQTAVIALAAVYPMVYLAERVTQGWFPRAAADEPMVKFLLEDASLTGRILAAALVVIAAPITEELVFRGMLYGVLRRYGGRLAAILTTSLLFAAIHVEFGVMLPLFVLAVAMALAYELTGSLWTAIGMHMLFNAISLAMILFFPTAIQ